VAILLFTEFVFFTFRIQILHLQTLNSVFHGRFCRPQKKSLDYRADNQAIVIFVLALKFVQSDKLFCVFLF
jgi:hypothetical protein